MLHPGKLCNSPTPSPPPPTVSNKKRKEGCISVERNTHYKLSKAQPVFGLLFFCFGRLICMVATEPQNYMKSFTSPLHIPLHIPTRSYWRGWKEKKQRHRGVTKRTGLRMYCSNPTEKWWLIKLAAKQRRFNMWEYCFYKYSIKSLIIKWREDTKC